MAQWPWLVSRLCLIPALPEGFCFLPSSPLKHLSLSGRSRCRVTQKQVAVPESRASQVSFPQSGFRVQESSLLALYSFPAIVSEVFFFVGLFLSLLSLKFSSNISLFMQVHLWEKENSLVCSASVTHPSGEQRLSHQGPLLLS